MARSIALYRRLMQFRLRSLFLILLVASVVATWYRYSRRPAHLGLDGYCPVTLAHEWRWERGSPKFQTVYEGSLYLFVSENEKAVFELAPDLYAPASGGVDIVRLLDEERRVPGERAHGLQHNGRIYLFDSEMTLAKFESSPDRYASLIPALSP